MGVLVNMNEKLSQLFKNTQDLELSDGLEAFILSEIGAIKRKSAQRKLALSYAGIFGSVIAATYFVVSFGGGIVESEFFSLISLAFSDLGIVLANWKEFVYSLLETFPVVYAAVILAPIFTLLLSFNGYLNNHNHSRHYSAT